jgi:hypothetical protein
VFGQILRYERPPMSERDESVLPAARAASSKDSAPARPKPKLKSKRSPPVEPTPVIGGRFLVAAAIIGGLVLVPQISPLGQALEPKEPPRTDTSTWKVGGKATVRITLVTADYAGLACAAPESFEGKHCASKSETEVWPRDSSAPIDDNKANIIQPYRTWLDNRLIMVAGLWATPALAMRLHIEPPGNLQPEKLARFVTECEVRFVGQLDKPKLRWSPGASWGADSAAPRPFVAVPESCKIIPEPSEPCPSGALCQLLTRL